MSAQLIELFEAAGRAEVAAAARDFPMTDAVTREYARAVGRRRLAFGAALSVAGALALGGIVFGAVRMWPEPDVVIVGTPTASATPSQEATASPSPSEASPSPSPTPSAPVPTETTPGATPAAPPAIAVPPQVTTVTAGPGGGSGEIVVNWEAVEGATGYRVYRSATADGDFARSAAIDIGTGSTRVYWGGTYEYIQIWQPSATSFEYVEVVDGAPAYFKVAAYNDAGTGVKSGVVCGAPPGAAASC